MKTGKYKTVIFDLDGTLLDTLGDLSDAVNYACIRMGFAPSTKEQVQQRIGNGVLMLIKKCLPKDADESTVNECRRLFAEYYEQNMDKKTRPYPQAQAILEAIKAAGLRAGISSNKYNGAVQNLTKKFLGDYIECAVGEGGDIRRKPCPDSALAVMKALGGTVQDSIYIGDSDTDVTTAHNAGIKCIGVTWGFRDRVVLMVAGADYIANSADEVLAILGIDGQGVGR